MPEERTGFGPRRPWLSVLAGHRSAGGDNTRAAAVSPLKSRPAGAGRSWWEPMGRRWRGTSPALVSRESGRPHPSSLLSAALAVCGTGGFSRVRRSPCRAAPKVLASCPGGGGAGTAAIPEPPASKNTLGREGPSALGAAGFGFGSLLPEEVSPPALELAVETRLPWDSEDPPASASRAAWLKAGIATPSLFVCWLVVGAASPPY